jgi:hypothetical protein
MKSKSPLYLRGTDRKPFVFESNGSIDEVLQAMRGLDEGQDFYNTQDTIEMIPNPAMNGYFFQYKLNRSGKYNTTYASVVADGQIWQADDGLVIVEGHASLTSYLTYVALCAFVILGCLFLITVKQLFLACFGGLIAIGFIIWMIEWERSLVIDNIERAVRSTVYDAAQ